MKTKYILITLSLISAACLFSTRPKLPKTKNNAAINEELHGIGGAA